MTFQINIDSLSLNVELLNKKRMKHCYLRVISSDTIQIKANTYFTKFDALDLIERKKDWIVQGLKKVKKNSLSEDEFLYFGKVQKKSDYQVENVDEFYKKLAKEYIPYLVDKHSKRMNLFPTSIKYRKNKNTWGSCNYKNGLNFNTMLCKFPLEVMEYVVIHELAHIKHKNHSKKFWDLVLKYCPDYKRREALLKSFL
ncbi:M48 family metallopeptidase [Arcobacter sp. YIC-464]|uniref:M48 family metallopeptidase n=1 Tax=Arcobacter sp. YIC-464 TaxID=3376631 RepID=UPI003C2827A7